jgi:glyoxylase-like metal-dependent hydrolase (beta-lactamase superfamily II)
MNISVINTGYFKLDGGAMFGIVPKRMWEKLNPPDENNLCTWSLRCILIEMENHKILIDTGIGDKQDEKFRSHFEPHGENNLKKILEKKGINVEDITDVFLTHLHFDHCGGAVSRNLPTGQAGTEGVLFPTFPNATYWTNQTHYNWAMNPNGREAASFLKENFEPLMQQGVLKFVEEKENIELFKNIHIHFTFGHTESMMMVRIIHQDKTFVYCADTLPSHWHIGVPYIMAYDIRPIETLKEKEWLLNKAVTEGWYLIFEHDPNTECATVKKDERGRIVLDKIFKIESLFN